MNNYSSVRVGVVGATGYAGIELLRLLARHPGVKLVAAMSSGKQRRAELGELVPALKGVVSGTCEPASIERMLEVGPDAVLLATPHEVSLDWVPELLRKSDRIRVIDLSGAFRFRDAQVFEQWYGVPHSAPELLAEAVYGWPEKFRTKIAGARLVANPGCYATAASTALWPLVKAGVADTTSIICDAKSGASGAGKGLREDLQFVELENNCKAYGVLTHRHTPEIAEQSGVEAANLTFTPHLLPVSRGILATSYVRLNNGTDEKKLKELYQDVYKDSRFVRVLGTQLPELNNVVNTNFCDVGFRVNTASRQAIIVTCLDNLLKGAAGQAVQNLNCMFGWPEHTALL